MGEGHVIELMGTPLVSLKEEAAHSAPKAIQRVTQDRLRSGYRLIDSEMYGFELSDDDFEYTWSSLQQQVGMSCSLQISR